MASTGPYRWIASEEKVTSPIDTTTTITTTITPLLINQEIDTDSLVSFFLINNNLSITPKQALIEAFTSDFPSFHYCCDLASDTNNQCQSPSNCPKAILSLTGYYLYYEDGHKHYKLPATPEPIFEFLCHSCAEKHADCTEGCTAYAKELWGYTVWVWDLIERDFREIVIKRNLLNPRIHGFFNYKSWRAEQTGSKRKHRDWERERKNKRQRKEASTSGPSQGVSSESPTPRVSSSSPELL